jgi:hypothetical protein
MEHDTLLVVMGKKLIRNVQVVTKVGNEAAALLLEN